MTGMENVLIVAGGPGHEAPVSLASSRFVFDNAPVKPWLILLNSEMKFLLTNDFHASVTVQGCLGQIRDGFDFKPIHLLPEELEDKGLIHNSVVFPIIHGTFGEDGALQDFFRTLGFAVAGCEAAASRICWDKLLCKLVLREAGLDVVPFEVITRATIPDKLPFGNQPHFIKPCREGSSFGVIRVTASEDLVKACEEALQFDSRILIEPEFSGRELECAVLQRRGEILVSEPGEILKVGEHYSFAQKYSEESVTRTSLAGLSQDLDAKIRRMAREAFEVVGGSGFLRVDFFLGNQGKLVINELNNLPGMTEISMFPQLFKAQGMGSQELIQTILEECSTHVAKAC